MIQQHLIIKDIAMKPSKENLDDVSDGIEDYPSEALGLDNEDLSKLVYKYPKSNRILIAVMVAVMGVGAYMFGVFIKQFPITALPYALCVDFYNITLVMPAQSFPKVWQILEALHLTESTSINKAISGAGMTIYTVIVLWLYAIWVEGIGTMIARIYNYRDPDISSAFKLYFMPALLSILYLFITELIKIW